MAAGCVQGTEGPAIHPSGSAWGFREDFPGPSGALWLWFPAGAFGNLTFISDNITASPFAIQLTWIPQEAAPEPLVFGYEMEFRHQEGNLSAGVGGTQVEAQLLGPWLVPFSAGRSHLRLAHEGPGHLALIWSGLPSGLKVGGDPELGARLASHTLLPAQLIRLDVDNDGFQAYTPAAQVEQGVGRALTPLPHLVNLRLIVPTNLGHGRVAVAGPAIQWEQQVPEGRNATCPDCFEVKRFIGLLDQAWEFGITYAGRSGSFQAYLTVAQAPASVQVADTNRLAEHGDCAAAFTGTCP